MLLFEGAVGPSLNVRRMVPGSSVRRTLRQYSDSKTVQLGCSPCLCPALGRTAGMWVMLPVSPFSHAGSPGHFPLCLILAPPPWPCCRTWTKGHEKVTRGLWSSLLVPYPNFHGEVVLVRRFSSANSVPAVHISTSKRAKPQPHPRPPHRTRKQFSPILKRDSPMSPKSCGQVRVSVQVLWD